MTQVSVLLKHPNIPCITACSNKRQHRFHVFCDVSERFLTFWPKVSPSLSEAKQSKTVTLLGLLGPWKWRHHDPLKSTEPLTSQHSATSQMLWIISNTLSKHQVLIVTSHRVSPTHLQGKANKNKIISYSSSDAVLVFSWWFWEPMVVRRICALSS